MGALVTGGAEDIYDLYFQVHDWFGVLSHDGEFTEGARPFDRHSQRVRDGGGGFVAIVEERRAPRPEAPVLAEVSASAPRQASTPVNAWPTDAGPLVRCMRAALDEAGVGPATWGGRSGQRVVDFDRLEGARPLRGLWWPTR